LKDNIYAQENTSGRVHVSHISIYAKYLTSGISVIIVEKAKYGMPQASSKEKMPV
jgi:hypothetical protein